MTDYQEQTSRWTLPLAFVGTALLVGLGVLIADGRGESLLVGAGALIAAALIALVSPAAGIVGVLLAAPTMYDLFPMPRGTFSLLELALLTSTAGIGLRFLIHAYRHGWSTLAALCRPAQLVVPVGMLVLAAGVALATIAEPAYRSESLREVRTVILEPVLFLFVARLALRDRAVRHVTGWALALCGTAVAGYAVVQIALDLGGVDAKGLTRATATYTHPNNLALFLERTLLLTLGVGIVRPRWWPVWLLAAIQFVGLLLTFSRGALVAVVIGLALLLLLRGMVKWLLLLLAGGIGAVGAGFVLFPDRFIDAGGAGAEPTRFTIWRASWEMVLDHPLFGVGPDQFLYQYSRRYIEPMGWPERYTSHPHNIILDVWLRLGVVGLAAISTLVVGMAWWVRSRYASVKDDPWAMGAIAALTGGLAHGMLDNGFFLPDLAVLTWFFLALLTTVQRGEGSEAVAQSPTSIAATWPDPVPESDNGRRRLPFVLTGLAIGVLILGSVSIDHPLAPFGLIAASGLMTIVNPAIGLAALLVTIPVQDAVLLPFVRGEVTLTQVVLFGLVLGWAVTLYRYRVWLDAITAGFLLVCAAYAISLLQVDDVGLWAAEVYRWMAAAVVYVIARSVLITWQDVRITLVGITLGIVVAAGTVVDQYVFRPVSDPGSIAVPFRAQGAFGVPNPLAAYMEFSVPLLLVFGLLGVRRFARLRIGTWLWIASLGAGGIGLVIAGLTQSRGGFVGMAAALVVIWLYLPKTIRIGSLVTGVLLAAVFLVTPVGQSQVSRFVEALDEDPIAVRQVDGGFLGRESLWRAGIAMIEDEPLTGIGAGEYDYHYREYVAEWIDRFPRGQAHNGWLQMGAQAGVPGMVAFSVWLAASIAALYGAAKRSSDQMGRLLAWGGVAIFVAFTLHTMVDYLNVLSLGIQLSVVTAIGLALAPDPLRSVQRASTSGNAPVIGSTRTASAA